MTLRIALTLLLLFAACDDPSQQEPSSTAETAALETEEVAAEKSAEPARPAVRFAGEFGTVGQRPVREGEPEIVEVPEPIIDRLNEVAEERIGSAFAVRKLSPGEEITVELGGPGKGDGLRIAITHSEKTVARHVPPATNEPELVSNLDHTVNRVLDELGVPRE